MYLWTWHDAAALPCRFRQAVRAWSDPGAVLSTAAR